MLAATTRRVRQLRVQAASAAHAHRGALLVEDALRTASLPFADGGRLVAIRRLALGSFDPLASAATVALRLESAIREMKTQAVPFDDPAAAQAPVVFFASISEAIVQAARRLARHKPVSEWFWRSALPGLSHDSAPTENWLRLVELAQSHPGASAALVAEAASADALDELLAAIPVGRGRAWLQLAGWSIDAPTAPTRPLRFAAQEESWLTRQTTALSPADDRILWLGTMLALSRHPALAADPELPARVQAALAAAALRLHVPDTICPPAGHAKPGTVASAGRTSEQPDSHRPAARATGAEVSFRESPELADRSDRSDPTDPPDKQYTPHPRIRPLDSTFGESPEPATASEFSGLFFLVPVLRRLGIEARLTHDPWLLDAHFPARFLLHAGQRLGLLDADPQAGALREILGDTAPALRPLDPWLAAVRRWCRRHTGLHLREIVRRPGHVRLAPAHVDVTFAPGQADLDLRRAGLDLDPGWVPWLGLVIRYHYSDAN